MKCEFCEKILPEDAISCPSCGSIVRNFMSEKGHTIISIEQQNDIENYKMSSYYKAPEEKNTDEEVFFGIDMSQQKFAAQKFSSNNSFKPKITNSGNVVINANGTSVGYSLPHSCKTETEMNAGNNNAPKKCEFCGQQLPENAASCPECGSMVRRFMSDKGNTVISLEQQNNIGKYKMNSNYKTPQEELTEEEILYGVDMSHKKFAQQKFESQDSYKAVASGRDVVLSADNSERTSNPNRGKYTIKTERSVNMPEEIRPKKVSLRKNPPQKLSLRKSNFMSKKYVNAYIPLYGDEHSNNNQFVQQTADRLENIAEVPPGLDKNQFLKLNYLHKVRIPYFSAIVILYICMVGMLFESMIPPNPYNLINIPFVMIFTYGLQFKINYNCAFFCFIFGLLYSFTGPIFYHSSMGFPILIAGILAVLSTRKFNELWDMYQKTGTLPYTQNRR